MPSLCLRSGKLCQPIPVIGKLGVVCDVRRSANPKILKIRRRPTPTLNSAGAETLASVNHVFPFACRCSRLVGSEMQYEATPYGFVNLDSPSYERCPRSVRSELPSARGSNHGDYLDILIEMGDGESLQRALNLISSDAAFRHNSVEGAKTSTPSDRHREDEQSYRNSMSAESFLPPEGARRVTPSAESNVGSSPTKSPHRTEPYARYNVSEKGRERSARYRRRLKIRKQITFLRERYPNGHPMLPSLLAKLCNL